MKDEDSIEQINSKEYTIFIRPYEEAHLVYILQGVPMNVPKKMMRIALRLQENDFGDQFAADPYSMLQVTFSPKDKNIIESEIYRDIVN